jgi:hypothetical protein
VSRASEARPGTQGDTTRRFSVRRFCREAPGSRIFARAPRSLVRDTRAGRAKSRRANEPLAVVVFTMSNSAVFRSRGAFVRPSLSVVVASAFAVGFRGRAHTGFGASRGRDNGNSFPPMRGRWSADRALFDFVALARRDVRAFRHGLSRSERDLSRRSTAAIFGRGSKTLSLPGVKTGAVSDLFREPQGSAEGSRTPRGSGSRRSRGRHSPLRLDRLRRRPS